VLLALVSPQFCPSNFQIEPSVAFRAFEAAVFSLGDPLPVLLNDIGFLGVVAIKPVQFRFELPTDLTFHPTILSPAQNGSDRSGRGGRPLPPA
jgi:hypothetical protein